MWSVHRITTNTALLCLAFVVVIGVDLVQAESTGGSIGSNEKTLSGSVQEPSPAGTERPSGRGRHVARTRRSPPQGASRGEGGLARFDGTWTVVSSAGCRTSGTRSLTVSGGQVTGFGISGTISTNGMVRIVGKGDGVTVVGTGRITGNTGSGTFRQSDGCSGSIRSVKN
jgi:hypothetical protein